MLLLIIYTDIADKGSSSDCYELIVNYQELSVVLKEPNNATQKDLTCESQQTINRDTRCMT